MPDKNLMVTKIAPPEPNDDVGFLGVKDNPNYVRDPYSSAIFNLNDKEVQEYLDKKRLREEQKETKERLNSLESDLKDIKSLLVQLINK